MEPRHEKIAKIVFDCGLRIHKDVGPGLLESVYETVLASRLLKLGLQVERQKPIQIRIDEITFPDAFSSAANGALVQNLMTKLDKSWVSKQSFVINR